MKVLKSILLLLGFVLAFSGCDDFLDDDHHHHYRGDYWIAMGTLEGDNDSFIVETDGGNRLYPKVNHDPEFDVIDGQRAWVNYTILGTSRDNEDIDYYVRINRLKKILTKVIFELTHENSDSIGNDPIKIKSHWMVNNYLNIKFYYQGGRTVHYITLARDINEPKTPEGNAHPGN